MAMIEISEELIFDLLKEQLLLPNPIRGFGVARPFRPATYSIHTDIDGFGDTEMASPIYQRDRDGKVTLLRIDRLKG